MTYHDQQRLLGRAQRAQEHQYFVYYTGPHRIGWNVVSFWSPNSLECAKGEFLNEFWDERPEILFIICPGAN